ncbi:hypothetical protein GOODEAATRI_026992 [Goodea atripinnis]|uniref:Uncharacterized protein n=1 Tax=Goodea atripinnis TaxID=208336 RepID=A0ABV0PS16_9TELE
MGRSERGEDMQQRSISRLKPMTVASVYMGRVLYPCAIIVPWSPDFYLKSSLEEKQTHGITNLPLYQLGTFSTYLTPVLHQINLKGLLTKSLILISSVQNI